MQRLREILEQTNEPAPRPTRRRVGTAVLTLIVFLFGWAVFKHLATGDLSESEVNRGIDELAAAMKTGDSARFESAEQHFIDAASVSVLDDYPAFLIRTGRRIAQGGEGEHAHDRIAAAVVARDFEGARKLTRELEADRAVEYWTKLLDALESRLDE